MAGQRQICRDCGQEITFRFIDGSLRPIHLYGGCGSSPYSTDALRKAQKFPCPKCGLRAWLVRHNGGTVWVDELGPPWPKHACVQDAKRLPAIGTCKAGLILCSICQREIPVDYYYNHCKKKHKGKISVPMLPQVADEQLIGFGAGRTDAINKLLSGANGAVASHDSNRQILCNYCNNYFLPGDYIKHLRKRHGVIQPSASVPPQIPPAIPGPAKCSRTALEQDGKAAESTKPRFWALLSRCVASIAAPS